jgi:ABC-type lipoprotein release transport system permease subunit
MLAESILLTTVGVGLGLLIGLGGAELLSEGIDFSRWSDGLTGYGIPTKIIPSVRTGDLRDPVVIAVITAILASLWPALRAARIQPADAIRHV